MTALREWRESVGWTLEEVADLAGVSVPMLSLAERGKRQFAPSTKVQFSRRIGVRISVLFPVDELVVPDEPEGPDVSR